MIIIKINLFIVAAIYLSSVEKRKQLTGHKLTVIEYLIKLCYFRQTFPSYFPGFLFIEVTAIQLSKINVKNDTIYTS